jgi:hypothetical protein
MERKIVRMVTLKEYKKRNNIYFIKITKWALVLVLLWIWEFFLLGYEKKTLWVMLLKWTYPWKSSISSIRKKTYFNMLDHKLEFLFYLTSFFFSIFHFFFFCTGFRSTKGGRLIRFMHRGMHIGQALFFL